jgi:hypothetical protein
MTAQTHPGAFIPSDFVRFPITFGSHQHHNHDDQRKSEQPIQNRGPEEHFHCIKAGNQNGYSKHSGAD